MNAVKEKVLIYDIETKTPDGTPNPERDEFRGFGCYSYITNDYYFLTDLKNVKHAMSTKL